MRMDPDRRPVFGLQGQRTWSVVRGLVDVAGGCVYDRSHWDPQRDSAADTRDLFHGGVLVGRQRTQEEEDAPVVGQAEPWLRPPGNLNRVFRSRTSVF